MLTLLCWVIVLNQKWVRNTGLGLRNIKDRQKKKGTFTELHPDRTHRLRWCCSVCITPYFADEKDKVGNSWYLLHHYSMNGARIQAQSPPSGTTPISQSLSHWWPASNSLKVYHESDSQASRQPTIFDLVQAGLGTCILLSSLGTLMGKWSQNQDQYFARSWWTRELIASLASLILYVFERRTHIL